MKQHLVLYFILSTDMCVSSVKMATTRKQVLVGGSTICETFALKWSKACEQKDRTVLQTAVNSDVWVSSKGRVVDSLNLTEVWTLAIDCESEEADRYNLSDYWKGQHPQHKGLSGNLRPYSSWVGRRQADKDESLQRLAHGRRKQSPTTSNSLLPLHGSRIEHSNVVLPYSLVR